MTDPAWILYDKPKALAEAKESGKNLLALPVLPRPRVKVILVSGPPGSGKTSYVAQHRVDGDITIDLDEIKSSISGKPIHQNPDDPDLLRAALVERNRRLEDLSEVPPGVTAWLISGSPKASDREHWRETLGAEVVVFETPIEELKGRIENDESRVGRESEMLSWAEQWWGDYEEDPRDEKV